jgi:hypothetical protein
MIEWGREREDWLKLLLLIILYVYFFRPRFDFRTPLFLILTYILLLTSYYLWLNNDLWLLRVPTRSSSLCYQLSAPRLSLLITCRLTESIELTPFQSPIKETTRLFFSNFVCYFRRNTSLPLYFTCKQHHKPWGLQKQACMDGWMDGGCTCCVCPFFDLIIFFLNCEIRYPENNK